MLGEKEESGQHRYTATTESSPPYVGIAQPESSNGIMSPSHLARETENLTLEDVDGRLRAHVNARNDTPSELETNDWVMEDIDSVYEAMPERTRTRKRTRRTGSDVYEVTEEYTESTTVTQTFEHVSPVVEQPSTRHIHRRMRSEPLSLDLLDRVRTSLAITPQSESAPIDDPEWAAVDRLLDQELISTPSNDDPVEIAVSREETSANNGSEQVQLVLRTTSHKLLSRKRVVRRISTDEVTSESTTVPEAKSTESRGFPWSRGRNGSPSRRPSPSSATSAATTEPVITTTSSSPRRRKGILSSIPVGSDIGRPVVKLPSIRARSLLKPFTMSSRRTPRATSPTPMAPTSSPVASSAIVEEEDEDMLDLEEPVGPPSSPLTSTGALDSESSLTFPVAGPSLDRGGNGTKSHRRLPSFSRVDSQSSVRFSSMLTEAPPAFGTDTPEALFPHDLLLKNIHRFMKFSSAAYGQNFLRIFGMGSSEFHFPSTDLHHANTWSFVSMPKPPFADVRHNTPICL